MRIQIATLVWFVAAVAAGGCSNKEPAGSGGGGGGGGKESYVTIGAYCDAFCPKLCDTCGDAACPQTCRARCLFGRDPNLVLDGKDPKVGLARTQANVDACLATVTKEGCPSIMAGQVPPACYTIQH